MKIDLATPGRADSSFDFRLDPTEINLGDENIRPAAAVRVAGELNRSAGGGRIRIDGKIQGPVGISCTRCLDSFEKKLEIPFKVVFAEAGEFSDVPEEELDLEDLEISPIEGNEIDLGEIVREQILLARPAQEFCREDCRGLCAECGQNLNLADCRCSADEIDPRWAALKDLKIKK